MKEVKSFYRILAQTDTITITAQTSKELSEKEAKEAAEKEVLLHPDKEVYHRVVAIPLCTKEQWKGGNVNFCPRCGERLTEPDEDDVTSEYYGECYGCGAQLEINIRVHEDEDEEMEEELI